ncbi:MAG: thiamine pyrophosphate-binding protein [Proteobacteria bacterium]|nr:thiamine pyrophosphate-binding protein [Pseudomonadota bacterium]
MKASDAVAKVLAAHDTRFCFELIGGMIAHILDSIGSLDKTQIVSTHHEQAAAFAAEGVARASQGKELAVAMGTSGPGATNLLTGIGSCWFDYIPVLFITGQVNTGELRGTRPVRQQGFQELDIVEMARPITKYAVQITDAAKLIPELQKAIALARSGRMGPVLIDIPNDIQRADIPDADVEMAIANANPVDTVGKPASDDIHRVEALCALARKPLICFGGGARWAPSLQGWVRSLERLGIPYVSTLMGHERTPASGTYFNMIGAYGNREANWAVQHADLLIAIGTRLDVRQTGADSADFARAAKIVQVDVDPAQLNNRVRTELAINADAQQFMSAFAPRDNLFPKIDADWLPSLRRMRLAADFDEYPDWEISPTALFKAINATMHGEALDYVCDVGNHQMWAAHGLRVGPEQAVHYSGGMGAMGFALPAAIGIALQTGRRGLVLTGDGSLQVNIQELDTLVRLNLDIAVIVMNNSSLGMVKNFQDLYFDGRDQSTRKGYSFPDFSRVARAYGIEARRITNAKDLPAALNALKKCSGPYLLELDMPYATECRPRLAFGRKLDEQLPPLEKTK